MEVYAATGRIDLEEDAGDVSESLAATMQSLATADPDAVEDQTYRCLRFDVCAECHKVVLERPLG